VPSAAPSTTNLDFASGRLTGWEGQGFYVTTGTGQGPSLAAGVCSSDCGKKGRKALLHRTFVVPAGAGFIRFSAAAVRHKDHEPGPRLDVFLEAPGRRLIPKQVRTAKGVWETADELLPPQKGRAHEYQWAVHDYAGQTVRIVLLDEDDRPACHVFCRGFQVFSSDEVNGREFATLMNRLAQDGSVAAATRYDTKHFMAFSTANDLYTEHRLYNCETIYALFFSHFRRRGIPVREPTGRLMVAIFDSQTGIEGYLGYQLPSVVTGLYHPATNRLLVYDYGTNRALVAVKKQGQEIAKQIKSDVQRQRVIGTFSRQAQEWRDDANIGTIVHEVAHQLSFNGGMLNREGDVPLWLAEGLATYCEATDNGAWQGIGEPNSLRANVLAVQVRGNGGFMPLSMLVESDDWLRKATNANVGLLGYSQSWALFHMLMEEQPQKLRKYLALIYPRRTPDYRLDDFIQVFGDLNKVERQYQGYMKALAKQQARAQK
jgi:hypothetical protein